MRQAVRIVGTGSFLPGAPVPPERVEATLGAIPGISPRLEARAQRIGAEVLSRAGVTSRHYALDPATRAQTETNASMLEKAIRAALAVSGDSPRSIDLLICAGPMSDYSCPPTSAIVQGRLGIPSCTEIEIHSNCTGAPKGLQIALDMLRVGRHRRAAVAYSQLSSVFLRGEYFNGPEVGLENLALRWMMSDGAGAMIVDAVDAVDPADAGDPGAKGPLLLEAFVESTGGEQEPGMSGGSLGATFSDIPADGVPFFPALHASGRHHVAQDLVSVGRHAPRQLVEGVGRMLAAAGLRGSDVAHFRLGIPGRHFMTEEVRAVFREKVGVDPDVVPFDVADFGYCGGATLFIQVDRLIRSGRLARGEIVAAYLEESSKWMSGGLLARG